MILLVSKPHHSNAWLITIRHYHHYHGLWVKIEVSISFDKLINSAGIFVEIKENQWSFIFWEQQRVMGDMRLLQGDNMKFDRITDNL